MNASAFLTRHTLIADPPLAKFLFIGLDRFLLPLLGTPWKAPKPTAPTKTAPVPQLTQPVLP